MIIGIPKEIKIEEHRVGLTPYNAKECINHGHRVLLQAGAGAAIGFSDAFYAEQGVEIVPNAEAVFADADMIVKVKEPQPSEYALIKPGQILFTYLHLAPDTQQTQALIKSKSIAIAYETVTDRKGRLPLLAPMSEVAGRLSVQVGAHCLEKPQGGCGKLLGGVPGVKPGKVVVIGAGVVGTNAVRMAMGQEAQVTVLDRSIDRLAELDMQYGGRLNTLYSSRANIEEYVSGADLVIGAVLLPGKSAPRLVSRELMQQMQPGSVLVDVAIDQGGCFESSRPTTHTQPTYVESGVVHYCVTNMPGAVPRTSTVALNNVTMPYVLQLANKGWRQALIDNPYLREGLNVCDGMVTCEAVARDQALPYQNTSELLA